MLNREIVYLEMQKNSLRRNASYFYEAGYSTDAKAAEASIAKIDAQIIELQKEHYA